MLNKILSGFFILSLASVCSVFSEDPVYLNSYGEPYILVEYEVDGNKISNPKIRTVPDELKEFLVDKKKHNEIWELFINLIPFEIRKDIKRYYLETDGMFGATAGVRQFDKKPTDWMITIDIIDAYLGDKLNFKLLAETLIHELGHTLTLNTTQIDMDYSLWSSRRDESYELRIEDSSLKCEPNYFVNNGCTKTDSYFNLFYQKFWVGFHDDHQDMLYEYEDNAYAANPDMSEEERLQMVDDATRSIFLKKRDRFVTEYSATSPGEDIAESWTYFVLLDKPDASAKDISEEKILFFYQFPELVEYRQQIRDAINTKYASYSMLPWTPKED
jgi:hypothetical protein